MTVFLAESRERSFQFGMSYGSLIIDYESQKIKNTVLSFLCGLWMDLSG